MLANTIHLQVEFGLFLGHQFSISALHFLVSPFLSLEEREFSPYRSRMVGERLGGFVGDTGRH